MMMTVEQIKELMEKMVETGLGQFSMECDSFKLKLSSKKQQENVVFAEAVHTPEMPAAEHAVSEPVQPKAEAPAVLEGSVVESPIVGTFYASPSPDKDAFVRVGQQVKKGDVLFIIESMKLMNEIQSEMDGEVVEILVENGTPVEYGQPIMRIK